MGWPEATPPTRKYKDTRIKTLPCIVVVLAAIRLAGSIHDGYNPASLDLPDLDGSVYISGILEIN